MLRGKRQNFEQVVALLLTLVWIGCWLLPGNAWAQDTQTANPTAQAPKTAKAEIKQDAAAPTRVILHISGSGPVDDMAVGANLLLAARLLGSPDLDLVSRPDVTHAADQGKIGRSMNLVFHKDIPYLGLKTEASLALMGWLDLRDTTFHLSLRTYDGVTGAFKAGVKLTRPVHDVAGLIEAAAEAMPQLVGRSVKLPANTAIGEGADTHTLDVLGAGWRKLGEKSASDALLDLAEARSDGLDISGLFAAWLPQALGYAGKELARRSQPVQALAYDLMGQAGAAQARYSGIKISKKSDRVVQAYAAFLIGQNRASEAVALLERLPKDARSEHLMGTAHLKLGQQSLAVGHFKVAWKLGLNDPIMLTKLAELDSADAADWHRSAAEAWLARQRFDKVNEHALAALKAGASESVLDLLRVKLLSVEARAALVKQITPADPDKATRPVLLALARLFEADGKLDEASEMYLQAAQAGQSDAPTWARVGRFFLDVKPDIDKAINHLKQAHKLDPDDHATQFALGRIYARAEFCDKAYALAEPVVRADNRNTSLMLDFTDLLLACGHITPAINTLNKILAWNPEYVPAIEKLEYIYRSRNDNPKIIETLNRLQVIDPNAANAIIAANKPKTETTKTEAEKIAAPRRKSVDVGFDVTRELVRIVPGEVKAVAVVNMARLKSGGLDGLFDFFFKPTHLNGEPLALDFIALLQAQGADLVSDESIGDEITLAPGPSPFTPAGLKSVIASYQLDGIALYDLSETADGSLSVDFYLYQRDAKAVLHSEGLIAVNVEALEQTNLGIIILPILLVLLIGAYIFWQKQRGVGELTVNISYSSTFEDGYFAIRLVKDDVDQAFNVEGLMKKKYEGTRQDTEAKIRKYFASKSPLKTMAHNNIARLEKVPPGQYIAYIVGIMVNIDTRVPIGSYEVKRDVTIEKDGRTTLDVNLEQTEAYIEIKAMRQQIKKRKVMEKVDGKMKEVEREVQHFVEVGGVTIEVNNDPALSKVTLEGEGASYYLPLGTYRILATYEDLGAATVLEVTDTSPQQIDLRLVPRKEVKLPEMTDAALSNLKTDRKAAGAPSLDLDDFETEPPVDLEPTRPKPGITKRPVAGIRPSVKSNTPEAIELADDILDGPAPIIVDNSPIVGDNTQIPIDIDDLFTAPSEVPVSEMMGVDHQLSDSEIAESGRRAEQMQADERWEEAAELYLRAGRLDDAAEMCQRSGNQTLNYKIYGLSYLKAGQHREAAEMFKYADEPLLEAEALEGLRLYDEANRKRGSYWEQRGDIARAMKHYQKASAFDRIGEMHERMQNFDQAGEAFFRARLFDRAAQNFEQAADIKHAAEAYEMDGNFEKAAELYKKLGSNVKVFNLLEKSGRYFEAAEGYKKFGLLDEAIHACQQVPANSPDFLKAALIMGKIFVEKNEQQLARSVYHKVVDTANIDQNNIEKYYEFGVLIQEQGMIHEAYALFERLQTVKYNYADVTIRLQNLVDRVEQERAAYGTAPPPGTVPPFPGYRTQSGNTNIPLPNNIDTPVPTRQTPTSNRYVFETELGRGAMGIVYMAKDTALDRHVAYKTVSNAIKENPASLKYFLSEAKSLAALNHQNIVTVFDVGQESNNYFITMEYVEGRSLGEFIREKGRLNLKNSVVIATKICSGLEYAHSKSVIHRDIKPSNIMISNNGEVKIMDFGLAKIMNEAVQDRTIVRGTPLYMAPEQVEGVGVDYRADIYSFGVTLFEMATGTLPFTKGDIAYHHLHTPPPSPIRYNPSLPEALEKIILKCLEKDKETRYQRVADIKRDLGPLRAAIAKR